jgi:hypothetical protein
VALMKLPGIMNFDQYRSNQDAPMMNAVSTSETSVSFYDTTRLNIPEDNHLHLVAVTTLNLTFLEMAHRAKVRSLNRIKNFVMFKT